MRNGLLSFMMLTLCVAGCSGSQDDGDASLDGQDAMDGTGGDTRDADVGGDPSADRDEGPVELWPWCPDASAYTGGDWEGTLHVGPGAIYCSQFRLDRPVEEDYQVRIQVRMVPGTYPIPHESGEFPVRLPVCAKLRVPDAQPVIAEPGIARAQIDADQFTVNFEQVLTTSSGQNWALCGYVWGPKTGGDGPTYTLDGNVLQPWEETDRGSAFWINPDRTTCPHVYNADRRLDSCHYDGVREDRCTVTFEGGQVEIFTRIDIPHATQNGLFHRAAGELDGVDFAQADFWKLAFHPELHFFVRDYLVMFDEPIGEVCGIKLHQIDFESQPPLGSLVLKDCDLADIGSRTISNESCEFL